MNRLRAKNAWLPHKITGGEHLCSCHQTAVEVEHLGKAAIFQQRTSADAAPLRAAVNQVGGLRVEPLHLPHKIVGEVVKIDGTREVACGKFGGRAAIEQDGTGHLPDGLGKGPRQEVVQLRLEERPTADLAGVFHETVFADAKFTAKFPLRFAAGHFIPPPQVVEPPGLLRYATVPIAHTPA